MAKETGSPYRTWALEICDPREWVSGGGAFEHLSDAEARAFFERFMADHDARMRALSGVLDAMGEDGADPLERLDAVESVLRALVGRRLPRRWPVPVEVVGCSPRHSLVLDAGVFLSRSLIAAFPTLEWRLETDASLGDWHKPVLAGFRDGLTLNPIVTAWVVANSRRNPLRLRDEFAEWSALVDPTSPSPPPDARRDLVVVLDKVDWQLEGDYPNGLSEQQAYVPVGLLLWWLAERGYATAELRDAGEQAAAGEVSAAGLYVAIDGVLTSRHIVEEVVPFVQAQLQDRYWTDLEELFPDIATVFGIPDKDSTRHLVAEQLDRRLADWNRPA